MACPQELMEIEWEYLGTLSKVTGFNFYAGMLTLNGNQEDGTPFSMIFTRTKTNMPDTD